MCFNPCYAGSKIESNPPFSPNAPSYSFNPCYAGSKIERNFQRRPAHYAKEFQSLLCWK